MSTDTPVLPAAPRIGFVSLGCPKALTDSELILTQLRAEGYDTSKTFAGADLVIVNTCGFIDDAVKESLDTIGEALAEFNRSGANVTYGNLLTVPVGDELMYVEPVYASLSGTSEANFPILRYVLVSYQDGVGIGTTLTEALEKAQSNAGGTDEPGTGTTTDM